MKKVLLSALLLLGLSIFSSCENDLSGSSWLVGEWADVKSPTVYFSFSGNGLCAYYEAYTGDYNFYPKNDCWLEGGTLYTTPRVKWDKDWEMEYKIVDGKLITAGYVLGDFKRIDKDTFILEDAGLDCDGTYVRIKGIAIKERGL